MASVDGAQFKNITESSLIKQGSGFVKGVIVNSHTSGTLKLVDGLSNGVVATTTYTSTGSCVPASHAVSELTSDATNVADGDTVTINTTVYRFKDTFLQPYDVKIGASAAISLDNLKLAVNATAGSEGVTYAVGTLAHPTVVAYTNTDTVQSFAARLPGITANTYPTTETSAHLAWADTTLGGGTGNSNPGVTTAGATFVLDANTYTAVIELSESFGATSVANQILWVTSEAVFLDNVKSAINRTGTPGTDYSTATLEHPTVTATTNANDSQVFNAKKVGSAGNSIVTTDTLANYAFTSTVMASGTLTTGRVICNTITFSAVATTGERFIPLYDAAFATGLLAVVGGTADLTVIYN
jgi:hypothetical protein